MTAETATQPLFDTSDWTFELMNTVHDAIEEIALGDLGLDV